MIKWKTAGIELCIAFLWILFCPPSTVAQSEKQPPHSQFAEFGDIKVHYNTVGEGSRAIIFIHGWACSAEFWSKSINEFPGYHVIAIDLPGQGRSDKPRTNYSMQFLARSINAVMKDSGVVEAILVGHSMGTSVIREFYRLYPEETVALVIVDGSLLGGSREEAEQVSAKLHLDYRAMARRVIDSLVQPIRDKQLKLEIRSLMLTTPDYVGMSEWEESMDQSLWTNDSIDVPVLAILAAESHWPQPETESFYYSIISDLDLQIWPCVSHFLMMEQPVVFNDSLRTFIYRKTLL